MHVRLNSVQDDFKGARMSGKQQNCIKVQIRYQIFLLRSIDNILKNKTPSHPDISSLTGPEAV